MYFKIHSKKFADKLYSKQEFEIVFYWTRWDHNRNSTHEKRGDIQSQNANPRQRCSCRGGQGPAETARSVNPIQTRGADYTPHITASPPNPAPTATETGSDVKPDTKGFHNNDGDGDFMSRITKGGKRLFIEEFPQASSPGNYLFLQAAIYI